MKCEDGIFVCPVCGCPIQRLSDSDCVECTLDEGLRAHARIVHPESDPA